MPHPSSHHAHCHTSPQPGRGRASNAAVYDAQRRLAELGYYTGPLDGVWGASTRDAIERFQADRRLAVTGDLNEATVAALDSSSATARNYPPYERPVAAVGPVTTRAVQERLRRTGYYRARWMGSGVPRRALRWSDSSVTAACGSPARRLPPVAVS
jgi:peptidoglycan hydrolase-like protein with peptidoglycan-binding domain